MNPSFVHSLFKATFQFQAELWRLTGEMSAIGEWKVCTYGSVFHIGYSAQWNLQSSEFVLSLISKVISPYKTGTKARLFDI